jgi:16S rRNA processing protein RimM
LKSSNSARGRLGDLEDALVPVATNVRLRGAGGRLTARLVPQGIDQLRGRSWVLVGRRGELQERHEVEDYKVYVGTMVLKLRGIDSAEQAASLVGKDILIPCNGLVDLPEGSYYIFELIGLTVRTRDGREIGVVREVLHTKGTPLLSIAPAPGTGSTGDEILLPAARSICTVIDTASGSITIDPPEGLLDLYGL